MKQFAKLVLCKIHFSCLKFQKSCFECLCVLITYTLQCIAYHTLCSSKETTFLFSWTFQRLCRVESESKTSKTRNTTFAHPKDNLMIADNSFVPPVQGCVNLDKWQPGSHTISRALAPHLYCSGKVGVSKPKNSQSTHKTNHQQSNKVSCF